MNLLMGLGFGAAGFEVWALGFGVVGFWGLGASQNSGYLSGCRRNEYSGMLGSALGHPLLLLLLSPVSVLLPLLLLLKYLMEATYYYLWKLPYTTAPLNLCVQRMHSNFRNLGIMST